MAERATTRKTVQLADLVPEVGEQISAVTDPEAAQAAVTSALKAASPYPDVELPPDDLVELLGGVSVNGDEVRSVRVRELTGVDEEALARAAQSLHLYHFIDTLLTRGTVAFGDEPESSTPKLLKDALTGDRDWILLAIRKTTFGDTIELEEWECPNCGGKSDLEFPVADIPVRKLDSERTFDIELKGGRKARVRLATGADQAATFADKSLTQPERDSILLSRCIQTITDPDETVHNFAGFPRATRNLAIPDRHKILKELGDRQPGPRFGEMKFTHEACGEEVPLPIGIGHLFPGV
jgi:hypothetical protein